MSYQKGQLELREAIELLRDTYNRDDEFTAANWMANNIKETDTPGHGSPYLIDILRWLFCDLGRDMVNGYSAILTSYPELSVVVELLKREREQEKEDMGDDAGQNWEKDLNDYLDSCTTSTLTIEHSYKGGTQQ